MTEDERHVEMGKAALLLQKNDWAVAMKKLVLFQHGTHFKEIGDLFLNDPANPEILILAKKLPSVVQLNKSILELKEAIITRDKIKEICRGLGVI